MVFSVKYRKEDGTLDTLEVEAESRAAIFPLLEKRGIKAIRVDDGPVKRSGWNQPKGANPVARRSRPSPFRGLIAGLVVCALAIGAYFAFFSGSEQPQEKEEAKKPTAIKEVKPAKVTRREVAVKPAKPKVEEKKEVPFWERPIPSNLSPEDRALWMEKAKFEKHIATSPRVQRYLKNFKPRPSTFNNGAEQVMDWIFNANVGDDMPPPLPPIAEFENNHIDELLDSISEIKEDDDEATVERKKMVDEAKKELKKFLAEGGTPEEFLRHYHNQLVSAYQMKSMVKNEINKEIDESTDSESSIDFIEKANKMLEDRGIPGVQLTDEQKDTLAEGFKK